MMLLIESAAHDPDREKRTMGHHFETVDSDPMTALDTRGSSGMATMSSAARKAPPLARLARWCFHHRRRVVLGWLAALVVLVAITTMTGSKFDSDFTLPHTDSQAAVALLTKNFPAASGEGDQIVIQAAHGTVRSPRVRRAVTDMLAKVANLPDVAAVGSPYRTAGATQISANPPSPSPRSRWTSRPAPSPSPRPSTSSPRPNQQTGRTSTSRSPARASPTPRPRA